MKSKIPVGLLFSAFAILCACEKSREAQPVYFSTKLEHDGRSYDVFAQLNSDGKVETAALLPSTSYKSAFFSSGADHLIYLNLTYAKGESVTLKCSTKVVIWDGSILSDFEEKVPVHVIQSLFDQTQ